MISSILESVKKVLGLEADYDAFDQDVIMHINSAFSTLNQLGVGPVEGFMIEDDTAEWPAFLGTDPRLNHIKSYIFMRVKVLFDPPHTAYLVTAMENQIKEMEWRINVHREGTQWIDPLAPIT